jgi:hypothetical protein
MPIRSMLPAAAALAAASLAGAQPAAAYRCALSPKGDAVIVKTDNPGGAPKTCTVTCRFTTVSFSCTQNIPAGARNWYVCLRPTGGKALGALQGGGEICR